MISSRRLKKVFRLPSVFGISQNSWKEVVISLKDALNTLDVGTGGENDKGGDGRTSIPGEGKTSNPGNWD